MVILRMSLVKPASSEAATDLLDLFDLGIKDAFDKFAAQAEDKMVAQGGQGQLGTQRHDHQQQQQTEKFRQHRQRGIDHGHQTQINKGNKPDSQRRTEQTQGNDGDKRPAILAPDKQQKFHNSQSGQQNSQQFKLLAHDIKNNSYFCSLAPARRKVRL